MSSHARPYFVWSPEYRIAGNAYMEPPEYGCDVIEVEARTKREAVVLGVKSLLAERNRSYAHDNRGDGQSPFAGYKAELAICPHGWPAFVLVDDKPVYQRCPGCGR